MHRNVSIFGLNFDLDPVAFTIPGTDWDVYWYGIIIATGFVLALIYGFTNAKRYNLNTDRMIDVILVAAPVAIICARLYYVIFDSKSTESFSEIFDFTNGGFQGLAIYGAIIGALLSGLLMCKLRKVDVLDMFDLAAVGFLIGQGVGRWGNFMNQEAFGSNTTLPWGMTSDSVSHYLYTHQESLAASGITVDPSLPVHPCFLYEFLWCALGVIVLHLISRRRIFKGQIILSYGMWYGLGRFFIEGLRLDSLMLGSNIRVSQALSLAAVLVCGAITAYMIYRTKKAKAEPAYESVFGDEAEKVLAEEEESDEDQPSAEGEGTEN